MVVEKIFNNLNENKNDSKNFYDKYVKFNKNRKEKINKSIIKLIKLLYKYIIIILHPDKNRKKKN